ncbi:MAG: phosphoglycerate dehydrogenase [Candidatus Omnitrophica bacterium]|nr:phosphoglycerate dehydrogenase [Candidatus Omnitrophota bacterium]
MKFKILVSDPLAAEGIDILEKVKGFKVDQKAKLPPDELKKIIGGYDALIIRSGTKVMRDIISAADNLKVIGRAGVGLDNVDVEAASKRGIVVMNTPGGNSISTAEHTMSLILSLSRNIPQADASMKREEWNRKKFMGVELRGKTLGVVGFGRIGMELSRRALSFEMHVIAYDPFLSTEKAKELGIELLEYKDVLKKADYITFHTPLTEDTQHMLSDKELKLLKKGVRIINCARGGIVDESAILKGIKSGKIAGCALDVYEQEPPKGNPLVKLANVVSTPHLGSSTEEAQINVAIDIAESVKNMLLGRGVKNAVNVPSVEPELLKKMQPYITLSEKMGTMQSQLSEGRVKRAKIQYIGDAALLQSEPITVAFIKGMLAPILQENINYVNARPIARERGISVVESKRADISDYANLIVSKVETDKGKKTTIVGTIFSNLDPRIVSINDKHVDAVPEGVTMVIYNKDVPGIIGQIGTILGLHKINIANMTFGRAKAGGMAISMLNIDSDVPKRVLDKIRKAKNILGVKVVKF